MTNTGPSQQKLLLFCFDSLQVKVDNKHTEFKILGQGVDVEPKGILQINEKTGEVTVHGPVDYEKYNVLKVRTNLLKSTITVLLQ